MHIEAFSEAKNPAAPAANEDALLILPGRAYAAIDGVSDRTGVRYDTMLAGQYAATLVRRRLEEILGGASGFSPRAIVDDLTATIDAAYGHFGIREQVRTDWGGKIASTLALAYHRADTIHILLVGDSGIRLNGTTLIREEKDLDRITALLRREAWRLLKTRTPDPLLLENLSRRLSFHGTAQPPAPHLDPATLSTIATAAHAACTAALPHIPPPLIAELIAGGIVGAQGGHQNNLASPLGYACLDGTEIPDRFIRALTLPRSEITTIELFTDGYFRPGEHFGVAAWEAAFQAAEAEDPAKVEIHLSPKGSGGGMCADDRSYLGVRL